MRGAVCTRIMITMLATLEGSSDGPGFFAATESFLKRGTMDVSTLFCLCMASLPSIQEVKNWQEK